MTALCKFSVTVIYNMSVFSYNTSTEGFQHPHLDVIDRKVVNVQLNDNIGANFKGNKNVVVDFELDGNNWCALNESYVSIGLDLHQAVLDPGCVSDGDTAIAWNAGSKLFSKVSHFINNRLVAECDNPAQVEAYYYRTHTSRSHRENTLESQWLGDFASRLNQTEGPDITEVQRALTSVPAGSNDFATNGAAGTYVNNRIHHQIIWNPKCLSTFATDYKYPPQSKHRLVFQISPDWKEDVVEHNGADKTATIDPEAGYDYTDINAPVIDDSLYYVNVNDLEFNYQIYSGKPAPDGPMYIPLRPIVAEYKQLYGALDQVINYSVNPKTYRVGFFLQNKNFLTNRLGYSKSDFTSNTTAAYGSASTVDHEDLTGFYFKIVDRIYPEPAARPSLTGDKLEVNRLYKDTMNALLKGDDWTLTESVTEWLASPYYVYPLAHADQPELASSQLKLFLNFDVAPSAMNCWTLHEYAENLELVYNEGALHTVGLV